MAGKEGLLAGGEGAMSTDVALQVLTQVRYNRVLVASLVFVEEDTFSFAHQLVVPSGDRSLDPTEGAVA